MTRDKFWEIIEEVRGSSDTDIEAREEKLQLRLRELSAEELASFCAHFNSCLDRAYDWRLWGAAYLMQGGCSDDSFWDFRSSLISMGKATFEKAVEDPDSCRISVFLPGIRSGFVKFRSGNYCLTR